MYYNCKIILLVKNMESKTEIKKNNQPLEIKTPDSIESRNKIISDAKGKLEIDATFKNNYSGNKLASRLLLMTNNGAEEKKKRIYKMIAEIDLFQYLDKFDLKDKEIEIDIDTSNTNAKTSIRDLYQRLLDENLGTKLEEVRKGIKTESTQINKSTKYAENIFKDIEDDCLLFYNELNSKKEESSSSEEEIEEKLKGKRNNFYKKKKEETKKPKNKIKTPVKKEIEEKSEEKALLSFDDFQEQLKDSDYDTGDKLKYLRYLSSTLNEITNIEEGLGKWNDKENLLGRIGEIEEAIEKNAQDLTSNTQNRSKLDQFIDIGYDVEKISEFIRKNFEEEDIDKNIKIKKMFLKKKLDLDKIKKSWNHSENAFFYIDYIALRDAINKIILENKLEKGNLSTATIVYSFNSVCQSYNDRIAFYQDMMKDFCDEDCVGEKNKDLFQSRNTTYITYNHFYDSNTVEENIKNKDLDKEEEEKAMRKAEKSSVSDMYISCNPPPSSPIGNKLYTFEKSPEENNKRQAATSTVFSATGGVRSLKCIKVNKRY